MSRSLAKSLRSTLRAMLPFDNFWVYRQRKGKRRLIDFGCKRLQIRSFADLGGVWGVEGEYTFYAMETHKIETAFLVDFTFPETLTKRKEKYPGLKIISGSFGDDGVAREIASVDAVILFDVLLHQVTPDWDDILEMYASRTKSFLIFNPQFIASNHTTRLLDLGEDKYFRNIPHTKDEEPYKTAFEKMYEIHPRPQYQQRRIYRDIHDIWQWGIVDDDLIAKMKSLGFSLKYFRNHGKFNKLANFENHAFAFGR